MLCYVVIVASVILITIQLPKIFSTTGYHTKPARNGPVDTDAVTDQCIHNLWAVLNRLQTGEMQAGQFTCPKTQTPYQVTRTGEVYTVQCPNPGEHGFSAIRIRTDSPIPEVVK